MDEFFELLQSVGAKDIAFTTDEWGNEQIKFVLNDKKTTICGEWHSDQSGGLNIYVTDVKPEEISEK